MQLACLLAKYDILSFIRFIICSRVTGNEVVRMLQDLQAVGHT